MKKIEALWLTHDITSGIPDSRPLKRDFLPQAVVFDRDTACQKPLKKRSSPRGDYIIE